MTDQSVVTEILADSVLRGETQTLRFERFANSIVGDYEGGVPVLPTSRSWDLGRDGRAETLTGRIFVCSSLTDHVDLKSSDDIRRLTAYVHPPYRLYFCSSQGLSELRVSEITAVLLKLVPTDISVNVLGRHQLSFLAEKFPAIFTRFYQVELDDLLATLQASVQRSVRDDDALRLALITVAHQTSDAVRKELYLSAIRTVLSDRPLNAAEIARDVSHTFRLSRVIPDEVLTHHISYMLDCGEITAENDRYVLSVIGQTVLAEQNTEATAELTAGRELVRTQLETSLGQRLPDDQFGRIWTIIRNHITAAFFDRGQKLVTQVSAMLAQTTDSSAAAADEPLIFVGGLAAAVAATSSHVDQQEELSTAIHDMFEEPLGPAFEWLSRLCVSYVALCALGLEARSGKAIARLLSKVTIVLDTDIALSLLCEGEPNHRDVVVFVEKWRALGGPVLVGREVVHEVAHHAAIANIDYEEVAPWLPGAPEVRHRLIENAFVRAFAELLSQRRIVRSQWSAYMRGFTRSGEDAPDLIAAVFAQDYGIHELPPSTTAEKSIEDMARTYLETKAARRFEGQRLKIAKDKARRDASLYASIVRESRSSRQSDTDRACLLVSSARRLAEVEERCRGVGEPQVVVTMGAVFYLLSLIPGVSIGIGAMQTLLFDVRRRFSSDLERVLLRTVHEASNVSIPWARRHTLVANVRQNLFGDAVRSSRDIPVTADALLAQDADALHETNLERTAEALRNALNSVAADNRIEKANLELREVNTVLRRELDILRKREARRRRENA